MVLELTGRVELTSSKHNRKSNQLSYWQANTRWFVAIMQRCLFTDLYIGWPRHMHGARVPTYSDFYCRGEAEILFGNKSVQIEAHGPEIPVVHLCNPAYPMKQWLQREAMILSVIKGRFMKFIFIQGRIEKMGNLSKSKIKFYIWANKLR